jgi:ankyrin repeat protein
MLTALYEAARTGRAEIVSQLIAAGASVNKAAADGRTPLYIAADQR